MEEQLIAVHMKTLLTKGFEQLMTEKRTREIALMFSLFARVPDGLTQLCSHFNAYIKVRSYY